MGFLQIANYSNPLFGVQLDMSSTEFNVWRREEASMVEISDNQPVRRSQQAVIDEHQLGEEDRSRIEISKKSV